VTRIFAREIERERERRDPIKVASSRVERDFLDRDGAITRNSDGTNADGHRKERSNSVDPKILISVKPKREKQKAAQANSLRMPLCESVPANFSQYIIPRLPPRGRISSSQTELPSGLGTAEGHGRTSTS
jgi:hypothetical protein